MPDIMVPLYLHMEACVTQENMNANLDATIKRGYSGIEAMLGAHIGECSIVGSGPSLAETWPQLRGDVLAVNQAIGYLISKGVAPKYAMLWDADAVVAEFAVPHPGVTYLVAARCHPAVFERLQGCDVRVWFAGGDHNISDYVKRRAIKDPLIYGGSAGVTRAMYFASALGYKKMNLFGADSSFSGDRSHIIKSMAKEKEIFVCVGDDMSAPEFRTTPELSAQVNEFREIYTIFCHPEVGIEVDVFGTGMLPAMYRAMKEKRLAGRIWNPDGTPYVERQLEAA